MFSNQSQLSTDIFLKHKQAIVQLETLLKDIPVVIHSATSVVDAHTHLRDYWTTNRSRTLDLALANLFLTEVSVDMALNALEQSDGEKLKSIVNGAGPAIPVYEVELVSANQSTQTLSQAFVIQLAEHVQPGQAPEDRNGRCFLYTAVQGIERFDSWPLLDKELLRRTTVDTERAGLLEELPLSQAAAFKQVAAILYRDIGAKTLASRLLEKQMSDVEHLLTELQQRRQGNSGLLDEVQRLDKLVAEARVRFARGLELRTINLRPQWLKNASEADQKRHVALERAHLESDIALFEQTKTASSFKSFARSAVAEFLFSTQGQTLDPDRIFVVQRYEIAVGDSAREGLGERKSLTEMFMWGAHDPANPYELEVEQGATFPWLTPTFIESAVNYLDLRVKYAAQRRRVYGSRAVQEAMRENLSCVAALSLFRAGLQKHLSPEAYALVESCHLGNPAHVSFGVAGGSVDRPLRDVVVYSTRTQVPGQSPYVLYTPGAPFEQEWTAFSSLERLQKTLARLYTFTAGRAYLNQQLHAQDRAFVAGLNLTPSDLVYDTVFYKGFELVGPPIQLSGAFQGAVHNLVAWGAAEEEAATPRWYRAAGAADRQLHTRLATEKKIIVERAKPLIGVESLNRFSRTLVHKVINDALRARGQQFEVDPDQVIVKLKGQEYMTLTQLFINWTLWERVPVFGGSMDDLPDSRFPNVSSIKTVDGHEVEGLSRSLINRYIVLRPADQYIEYLKTYGQDVDWQRSRYFARLKQNEMLVSALEQKMQGYLTQAQYNWLESIIEDLDLDPGTTPWAWAPQPGNTGIRAFHLAGKRIEGAYIFSHLSAGKWEHLLYLPGASSDDRFQTFNRFSEKFRNRELNQILLGAVRLEDRSALASYIDKRSLAGVSWEVYTERQNHLINFYREEYVRGIDRVLSDVDVATVSFSEAIIRDALMVVDVVADIASLFFPPVGLVVGVLRVIKGVVNGLIAYTNGDDKAANAYFASAWVQGIKIYLGSMAPMGIAAPGFDVLSRINDMSDIVSTLTGVPVGVDYIVHVAS